MPKIKPDPKSPWSNVPLAIMDDGGPEIFTLPTGKTHRTETNTIKNRICPECDEPAYSSRFDGDWTCPTCGKEFREE